MERNVSQKKLHSHINEIVLIILPVFFILFSFKLFENIRL